MTQIDHAMYHWLSAAGGFLAGTLLVLWVQGNCLTKLRRALDLHRQLYHFHQPAKTERQTP